jgi:lysophospholipase L1-like esterase
VAVVQRTVRRVTILIAVFALVAIVSARQATTPIRIVLVGDSTVTDDSGWGGGFRLLATSGIDVVNTAANGRSSKSFIDEGRWKDALALKGDYYLIQFGHNDEPGKGPERETDPATTYTANMTRYVDEARAIGARPVLVTSLARRIFDKAGSGRIVSTQTPFVEAVRRIAAAKRVPLVDLFARSVALSEKMGADALVEFSPVNPAGGGVDTTHLNSKGSVLFGRLVVEELRGAVPDLSGYLRRSFRLAPGERD